MKDPLELLFRAYFNVFSNGQIELVLFQTVLISMIACMFLPNLMSVQRRTREHKVSLQCRTLVRRIESLVPPYLEACQEFADKAESFVDQNPKLVELADQIPHEMKVKAERDFCLRDSDQAPAIALMQMEWTRLLSKTIRGG